MENDESLIVDSMAAIAVPLQWYLRGKHAQPSVFIYLEIVVMCMGRQCFGCRGSMKHAYSRE